MCSMRRSKPGTSNSSRPRSGVIIGGMIPVNGNFISSFGPWFHQQDERGAQKCNHCGSREGHGKFDVMIAHPAQCDSRDGADTDAHEVHEAVTGGAMFGLRDL